MNKVFIVLAVGASLAILSLIISPSSDNKVSPEVTDLYSKINDKREESTINTDVFSGSDGRRIVKGVLPPELKSVKERFEKYTAEIKNSSVPKETIINDGRDPDAIIAQMNLLIEQTGIDVVSITAPLNAEIPLNSDIQKVEKKRLAVEKDVIELERLFDR